MWIKHNYLQLALILVKSDKHIKMPFNYNISEYKYGYISQWNGLDFLSTFIKLHPSDQELADKLLCFIRYTLNLNFHEDTCEVLPSGWSDVFTARLLFFLCICCWRFGLRQCHSTYRPSSHFFAAHFFMDFWEKQTKNNQCFFLCTDTIHVFVCVRVTILYVPTLTEKTTCKYSVMCS